MFRLPTTQAPARPHPLLPHGPNLCAFASLRDIFLFLTSPD